MSPQQIEQLLGVLLIGLLARLALRAGNPRRRQHKALDAGVRQLVEQPEALPRGLVGKQDAGSIRRRGSLLQPGDQLRALRHRILHRASRGLFATLGDLQQHRFVVQITTDHDNLTHGQFLLRDSVWKRSLRTTLNFPTDTTEARQLAFSLATW